jgi:hypothetical protein
MRRFRQFSKVRLVYLITLHSLMTTRQSCLDSEVVLVRAFNF